jgi:hypothetical protein
VKKVSNPQSTSPASTDTMPRRLLALYVYIHIPFPHPDLCSFVPLIPAKNTSYGSRITMTQDSTRELFRSLSVNPLYIMNLIGRPDYWAPQTRWESDSNGDFQACGTPSANRIPTSALSHTSQTSSASTPAGTYTSKAPPYQSTCATALP